MSKYQVIVGNIGTVYDGDNGFKACQEYNVYVGLSREGGGRASGEDVTLMRDGEPWKEYRHDEEFFFIEETDTYGGESNYSWVSYYKVRAKTPMGAVRKATSYHYRFDYNISDEMGTKAYRGHRACVIAFVCRYDKERHGEYRTRLVL